MRVDLHLHTWISDGDVSPTELIGLATAAGLDVVAITDHDTAAGVGEARAAAAGLPLQVIPGIEISTRWEAHELHVLGYWIDAEAEPILEHQRFATRRRAVRMAAMVERLQEMGVAITYADVEAAAGPTVRTLGRPHLARALHHGGFTRYHGEAFVRYIGDGGPAFVGEGFPLPEVAIDVIHRAGGVAVLAHPPLPWIYDALGDLAAQGIDGIECFRPGMDPADCLMLERATRARGLFPTGGSDWHGPQRSVLGTFSVNGEHVREVLALGGLAPEQGFLPLDIPLPSLPPLSNSGD